MKSLKPGDEITIDYKREGHHYSLLPLVDRRELSIGVLNVHCNCSLCKVPDKWPVSAYFGHEIKSLLHLERAFSGKSFGDFDPMKREVAIMRKILGNNDPNKIKLKCSQGFGLWGHIVGIIIDGIVMHT